MIITIDGPAASGKTTVGRMLAKRLGCYYLYSGLLYRSLAYILVDVYNYTTEILAEPIAEDLQTALDPLFFSYKYDSYYGEKVIFKNQDITSFLKTIFIDEAASLLATNNKVREIITNLQRVIADSFDIVVDGRDAGSVVFPQASFKFFITAPLEERAERWRKQHLEINPMSIDEAFTRVSHRDNQDKNRSHAPLIIPDDAIIINTNGLMPEEVLNIMLKYISVDTTVDT